MRLFLCLFAAFLVSLFYTSQAQTSTIEGQILDGSDKSPIIGVGVLLLNERDTTLTSGAATDLDGNFKLQADQGKYRLKISYLGYKTRTLSLELTAEGKNLGSIALEQEAIALNDVIIEGRQIRSIQKGDTTEYNANAFKTNPDATVQDLISKMPGITIENGTVKAQGETIQKVTVDGKEFFGDDATMALKNLPAEVVDKIQVYNRLSDQAQFTGIDDGSSQKSLNIVTKPGKNNGQFGKVYAGYGTNERYQAGGNINSFKGNQRISVIGLANNINQQNFGSQDLLGVSGGNGGGGRSGGTNRSGGTGGGSGSNPANNFMTSQQGGINTTQSIGLNYTDTWGTKLNLNGSYFFNRTDNVTANMLDRQYLLAEQSNQYYGQKSGGSNLNLNHRFNLRAEYKIDSSNSLLITPRLSFQNNSAQNTLTGSTRTAGDTLLNESLNQNTSTNNGLTFSNNLLFRHKFNKARRSFSIDFGTSLNDKTGDNKLLARNNYYQNGSDSSTTLDQYSNTKTKGYTLSTNLVYTEPIGSKGALQVSYNPSYTKNNSEKITREKDGTSEQYTVMDSLLSNSYDNTVLTQKGGGRYMWNDPKYNFSFGVDGQSVSLDGQQEFPRAMGTSKNFVNILPNAMYYYKFSKTSNLRINYRAQTDVPSVTQLQNVINNTNPLQVSTGNPNLKQEYSHSLSGRIRLSNTEKARALYAFISGTYTQDYIGSSTIIGTRTEELGNGFVLNEGSQLTRPINLQGYWNSNALGTYSFPVDFMKSNLNLNAGLTYTQTPSQINQDINFARTLTENLGFALGSNISEKVDFTVSSTGFYTIVKNSFRPQLNNNYYNQISGVKVNLMPWQGLVLTSEWNHTFYTGLGAGYDINFVLWNAGIGYKFFKNRGAELRLSVFDLLDQNKSVTRNVTGSYVENSRTQVLTRYFMVTFTYNFRNFAGNPSPPKEGERPHGPPPSDRF